MKRSYVYLCKYRHKKIRFCVDEPDYSNAPAIKNHDLEHTVYGKHEEDILLDAPPPLGKRIILTYYFDASLMHDVLSGKAVTGVCTFYNKTPVDWYYKQQSTSQKATYGAEFLSGRTCCEKNSTVPDAKLHKRHNILSFHLIRSMVSTGYINMLHIAT